MLHELISFLIPTAYAQAPKFVSLTNIPGLTELSSTAPLPDLLRNLFLVTIGFAAILGVIMIAVGGAEYMLSDKMSSISKGRARMTNALWGLGIILGSYLILNTINPDLLKLDILLPTAVSTLPGGVSGVPIFEIPADASVDEIFRLQQECLNRGGQILNMVCYI